MGKRLWLAQICSSVNTVASIVDNLEPAKVPQMVHDYLSLVKHAINTTNEYKSYGVVEGNDALLEATQEEIKTRLPLLLPPAARRPVRKLINFTKGLLADNKKFRAEIALLTQWTHKLRVYGSSLTYIAKNAEVEVRANLASKVGNNCSFGVDGHTSVHLKKRLLMAVGHEARVQFDDMLTLVGKESVALSAARDLTLTATNLLQRANILNLQARQEIKLAAGGTSITLSDGTITLRGGKIRIEGDSISLSAKKSLTFSSPSTKIN